MSSTHEPPRLMLRLEAGAGAGERLAAALAAMPVASVIIASPDGRPLEAAKVAVLVAAAQKAGAAALIEADARLARTLKADGVHIPASTDPEGLYAAAREMLGDRAIVGLDAGTSRHDAMTAGEAGADYIAFGLSPLATGREQAGEERAALIEWWAEIFEVPCVAIDVATAAEAQALAAAGADFVTVPLATGQSAAAGAGLLREVAAAMSRPRQAR